MLCAPITLVGGSKMEQREYSECGLQHQPLALNLRCHMQTEKWKFSSTISNETWPQNCHPQHTHQTPHILRKNTPQRISKNRKRDCNLRPSVLCAEKGIYVR